MSSQRYNPEFKDEAIRQIVDTHYWCIDSHGPSVGLVLQLI